MKIVQLSLTLLILAVACKAPEEPRVNYSDDLVNATLWYQNGDEMKAQYQQAYIRAGELLQKYLQETGDSIPAAVILDVDETVLDNSPYEAWLIQNGESYNPDSWSRWVGEATAEPLPGALAFTQMADSLGVEVFYITNRAHELLEPTQRNLAEAGFPQADEKHLMLKTSTSDKTERREAVKKDYRVLLLVGDQLTDFTQETAWDRDTVRQHFIMLPNPMYGGFLDKAYDNDYSMSEKEKAAKRKAALKPASL
ncbi:MAG: 5'-nucleotidase, lipoprotein e(P4) family [Owenweeksia sp.]|nr:5'-nucleotidase, lipoprotein e(P4) family [Owenweeksia sp.]MBF98216.1 5'-nucleotidase, lipoprotein e(P4) family [Owenweeksia sp.]HBF22044.1 5'-nucleotidase, lipoprotein e(P4) family [Cryomorphaceae bacterium]HCQ16451.1 5'-nucleotidase, lipoprotein e(P4) family [Cryomorphaceae bacterium]|tara:strand:- start:291 stop:1049 length:759 start_codon:yes stop_codon:yes gene_type:complete